MKKKDISGANWIILPMALFVLTIISAGESIAQQAPPGNPCPIGGHAIVACPVVTDSVIKSAVQARLAGSVVTQGCQINVQVVNGVVTLNGQVENPERRQLATIFASSVRGVIGVNNQLSVLRYNTPESSLIADVRKRLDRSADLRGKAIGVQASAGIVRLTGMVDTEQQREAAAIIASGVPGVTAVQNAISVRLPWSQ